MDMINGLMQGVSNIQASDDMDNQIISRVNAELSGCIAMLYISVNILSDLTDVKDGEPRLKSGMPHRIQNIG